MVRVMYRKMLNVPEHSQIIVLKTNNSRVSGPAAMSVEDHLIFLAVSVGDIVR